MKKQFWVLEYDFTTYTANGAVDKVENRIETFNEQSKFISRYGEVLEIDSQTLMGIFKHVNNIKTYAGELNEVELKISNVYEIV